MEYFVFMTNQCNLNCDYCSVLFNGATCGAPARPTYTNTELIDLIERTQRSQNDLEITVYFFGGEPSLEYEASMRLLSDMQLGLQGYIIKFILHTNGLLLHELPSELLAQLSGIICSINYEKIPHHSLANSYFSTIMDNILLTKQRKNITIIGRLTITEKTSLYMGITQFAHFFDYIYWQIENKPEFNDYKRFFRSYTYEVKITFTQWIQYLQNGIILRYVPFMAIMKFLFARDRSDTAFSCGYGSKMVYIQTDGTCYACSDSAENKEHFIGNITNGVSFTKPNLLDFRCSNCDYRRLCLGRCGRMHKEFTKKQISRYCALNKFMFKLFALKKEILQSAAASHPEIIDELQSSNLEYTEFTP